VGDVATVLRLSGSSLSVEHTGLDTEKPLHAVWVDETGGVWAVGGDVLVPPLGEGQLLHKGTSPLPDSFETRTATIEPIDAGGLAARDTGSDASEVLDASLDAPDTDAAPDHATPFDAASARDPGHVPCGAATCDVSVERCCVDRAGAAPPGCVDIATPCPAGFFPMACDERADCTAGAACCLSRFIQSGAIARAECLTECSFVTLCASDDECATMACTTSSVVADYPACQ
jgi:hypothetical protein